MKNIMKKLLLILQLLILIGLFTSCELLEKDEEEESLANDEFFTNKIPPRKLIKETIVEETVKVKEAPPVVKIQTDGFESLNEVKTRTEQIKAPPFYEKYLKGKDDKIPIYISFDAVPIHDIIPAFANQLEFSYAVDPAVKGAITLNVYDPKAKDKKLMMPRRDVWKLFEQILWMAGAYCSPEDDVLHIMPFPKMPRERRIFATEGSVANVDVRIIDIHNVAARTVLERITDFLTEGAKATELTGENALLIVETPENIPKLEALIKLLDSKHRTLWPKIVMRCSNVSATRITEELATILPVLGFPVTINNVIAEPGSIHLASVERLQAIVASAANKEALDEVIKWVSVLDRSDVGDQEQVYVYKVINSKAEELIQVLASIFNIEGVSMTFSGGGSSSTSTTSSTPSAGGLGGGRTTPAASSASSSASRTSTTTVKSTGSGSSSQTGPANIFEVPVKIFADGKNNRLIVRTTPRAYAMIKALLYRLDTIPVQVLLQVMIAEIRLGENTEFGMEFSGVANNGNKRSVFGTNYTDLIPQTPSGGVERGFKYLISSGDDKYAYIRGLAGTGNFKILSSPQLAALSGTQASLDVGQEIPIITRTLSDTNSASSLSTSNEVEYKKTGIILKITPQVTKGGLITIELDQSVSERGDDVSAGGQSYPSFVNRQVITSLSMRDGATLLVGGIIQETDRSRNDSLPLITKVPLLATLLGFNTMDKQRTELLIMVTASVISEETKLQQMIGRYKQSIKTIKDFNKKILEKKKKEQSAAENETSI